MQHAPHPHKCEGQYKQHNTSHCNAHKLRWCIVTTQSTKVFFIIFTTIYRGGATDTCLQTVGGGTVTLCTQG